MPHGSDPNLHMLYEGSGSGSRRSAMIRIDRNEVRNPLSLSLCSVFYLVSGQDEVFCVLICSLSSWGNLLLYMRFVWAVPLPPLLQRRKTIQNPQQIFTLQCTLYSTGENLFGLYCTLNALSARVVLYCINSIIL